MKKFFAAMIMVCLCVAFSNSAMAQGAYRDNGRHGQNPVAVNHHSTLGHYVGAVQAPRPAAQPAPPFHGPRHAQPAPPFHGPRHAQPAPPFHGPHHARPLPPPEPVVGVDIGPYGSGLYIGGEHFGIRISL